MTGIFEVNKMITCPYCNKQQRWNNYIHSEAEGPAKDAYVWDCPHSDDRYYQFYVIVETPQTTITQPKEV